MLKKWIEDIKNKNYIGNYINFALVLFTTLFIVFVFGPVHISKNSNALLNMFFLLMIALCCLGLSLLLACIAFFLKDKYKYLGCVLTGLLLLCFINATIIPFHATILDGRDLVTIEEDIVPILRNIIFLLVCIIASYILRKNLRYVAVPLLAICVLFTAYNQYSIIKMDNSDETPIKGPEDTLKSAATFSSKKNIIIIGVDALQGTIAEKTLIQNAEFLDVFDGFTLFTRAFSSFPFTNYSRPAIQSGKEYSTVGTDYKENMLRSIEDSFITDIIKKGARFDALGVDLKNIAPSLYAQGSFIGPRYMYGYAFAASIARISGYWPSNPFFKDMQNLMLNTKLSSVQFYQTLLQDFIVKDDDLKCLYFWDYTLHYPISLNRDGSVNAESAVYYDENATIEETIFEYTQLQHLFETMKTNNVYDNSLIILVSDHGHPGGGEKGHFSSFDDFKDGYKYNGNYMPINRYNAILFIKPPFARGEARLVHTDAWNGDVRNIVSYYCDNFTNDFPVDVVSKIRAEKPNVNVMFAVGLDEGTPQQSSKLHQTVEVGSLYEIPAAFAKKSGINDD